MGYYFNNAQTKNIPCQTKEFLIIDAYYVSELIFCNLDYVYKCNNWDCWVENLNLELMKARFWISRNKVQTSFATEKLIPCISCQKAALLSHLM